MKRTTRVKLLWAYMMILGLITGIVTGVVIFGSVDTEMSLSDMRIVTKKLSPAFCDNVDIENQGYDSTFDAYFMKHKPDILPDIRETYNETYSQFIEKNYYAMKQFYLLAGSKVKITGTVDSYIELNLIQGRGNLNKYLDSGLECIDCILDSRSLFRYQDNNLLHFDIFSTEDYFFVFVSRIDDAWIDLRFSLRRTVYDTSQYLDQCTGETSCVFDYNMGNSETPVVLIHAKPSHNDHFDENTITIRTSCVGRSWLFVLIFFGLPALLSIIISILIVYRCSEPQPEPSVTQRTRGPDERTPLLWDTVHSPAVVVLPPKYEDIFQADDSLPSYEEATGSNTISIGIQTSNTSAATMQQ